MREAAVLYFECLCLLYLSLSLFSRLFGYFGCVSNDLILSGTTPWRFDMGGAEGPTIAREFVLTRVFDGSRNDGPAQG